MLLRNRALTERYRELRHRCGSWCYRVSYRRNAILLWGILRSEFSLALGGLKTLEAMAARIPVVATKATKGLGCVTVSTPSLRILKTGQHRPNLPDIFTSIWGDHLYGGLYSRGEPSGSIERWGHLPKKSLQTLCIPQSFDTGPYPTLFREQFETLRENVKDINF